MESPSDQVFQNSIGAQGPGPSEHGIVSQASHSSALHSSSSIFDLFWNAGPMIKLIILSLLASSVWSWTIIISKYLRLKKLFSMADDFDDDFWSGNSLDALYSELRNSVFDPMSNVFCAAMSEWERFRMTPSCSAKSIQERISRSIRVTIRKEADSLEKYMGFLSSLGTNGVIVGLFGTVLGIMNGFEVIAFQQSSSITTVAPVISEALFATSVGFIAAIPAAIFHNILSSSIDRYIGRLETFEEEFISIVSRQFDNE
jgi:biopolymer transport protein TolQ